MVIAGGDGSARGAPTGSRPPGHNMPVARAVSPDAPRQAKRPDVAAMPGQTEEGRKVSPFRGRVVGGGLALWCGMVSLSLSTVVLLAVLSRHFHHQGFTGLSSLFGLLFVASLIPSGIPLRAAALIGDGATPPVFSARTLAPAALGGLILSPLLGYLLGLPVLAVALIVLQVLLAFPLGVRRGGLIAFRRFTALGANMFLEAACASRWDVSPASSGGPPVSLPGWPSPRWSHLQPFRP